MSSKLDCIKDAYIDVSEGKVGDVNFRIDTVHTQYTDRIELTPEQAQMVNLKGIGWVRDLCGGEAYRLAA